MTFFVRAATSAAILASFVGSFWLTTPGYATDTAVKPLQPAQAAPLPFLDSSVTNVLTGSAQTAPQAAPQAAPQVAPVSAPAAAPLPYDISVAPQSATQAAPTPAQAADGVIIQAENTQLAQQVAEDVPVITPEKPKGRVASSLAELVRLTPHKSNLSREQNCLATAVYYESKSETLEGQLAVARVVINRSRSGRFPGSLCGVVLQPSQFSFVRGGRLPGATKNSAQWRNAVAISQIAMDNSWKSRVEGALFFHATYVSPGWKLKRIATVDNHVFYR